MTDLVSYSKSFPISLRNRSCAYCGADLNIKRDRTRDHVIGRKFVPPDSLRDQWNLILNACFDCNNAKADLEDDISAITMAATEHHGGPAVSSAMRECLNRKRLSCRNRATGKLILDRESQFQIECQSRLMSMKLNFVGCPSINKNRIFALAFFHFQAFFYLITYNQDQRLGYYLPGKFIPFFSGSKSDWGNTRLIWFQRLVKNWPFRVHSIGASEYFKLIIRKHPSVEDVWAWAIEWNCSFRVVGFAGDGNVIEELMNNSPEQKYKYINTMEGPSWRYFLETPLKEDVDDLF